MTMTDSMIPLATADATLVDAVERSMRDLGARWAEREAHLDDTARDGLRIELRDAIASLGYCDVLADAGDRESWPEAAAVVAAAAKCALPIDMALWILTHDAEAAIADDAPLWQARDTGDAGHPAALRLLRTVQISAALHAALDLAIGYVQDRKQFGRALAKFQAIQHSLSVAAEHAAAADAACRLALGAVHAHGPDDDRALALLDAATLTADEAVDVVYDMTHQVHGAIGFTREYALHRHSVDLQRWRESMMLLGGHDAGRRLGARVAGRGGLWREVTALMAPSVHD